MLIWRALTRHDFISTKSLWVPITVHDITVPAVSWSFLWSLNLLGEKKQQKNKTVCNHKLKQKVKWQRFGKGLEPVK